MDSNAAEAQVEEQAAVFEQNKDYLIGLWDQADIDLDPKGPLGTS